MFVESNLLKYAPTAADELGCHGILKIDGVSTHTGEVTTAMALQKGYHSRTTPPNTTAVVQECDQIFGLLKDICRNNIDVLVEELQKRGGSGNLNGTHLPVMLCGREAGTQTYVDAAGNEKQQALPSLPSSFDALTEDVIKGAWEKTGYFPWNPDKFLNHKYVRHELYVDKDGNPVVDIDSKSNKIKTLLEILDKNIELLNDAGFNGDVFAIVSLFSVPSF